MNIIVVYTPPVVFVAPHDKMVQAGTHRYYDNNNITVVVEMNFQLLIVLLYRVSLSVLETNNKIILRIKRQQCLIKKKLKKQTKSSPIILRQNRLNVVNTAIAPLLCISTTTSFTTLLLLLLLLLLDCETMCVGTVSRVSKNSCIYNMCV
uniref:Uncharacterized protein n=1 Tax=Schizaphis graminum TaxID=13262 RepID=A0A2S2PPF4_SCHGA